MSKRKKKRKHRGLAPSSSPPRRRHRRTYWIMLVVTLAAGVAAVGTWRGREPSSAGTVSGGTPRLAVTPESVNLGDIRLDEWARVSLEVTNVGTGPLRFRTAPWVEVAEGC